jgi:hypothetical protein
MQTQKISKLAPHAEKQQLVLAAVEQFLDQESAESSLDIYEEMCQHYNASHEFKTLAPATKLRELMSQRNMRKLLNNLTIIYTFNKISSYE